MLGVLEGVQSRQHDNDMYISCLGVIFGVDLGMVHPMICCCLVLYCIGCAMVA